MAIIKAAAMQNGHVTMPAAFSSNGRAETPAAAPTSRPDSVEISQDAKELAQKSAAAQSGVSEDAARDLPLEAYSLPQWYADLSSDLVMVDTELGVPYPESRMARYDALSRQEKEALAEYQGKLHNYFLEGLQEFGIESRADYYRQIVQDPVKNEELHQAVRQKLSGDGQALRLMEYFGIPL